VIRVLAICQEDPHAILGGMGMHLRCLYRAMARRGDVEIDLLVNGPGEGTSVIDDYRKHQADKLVCWKSRNPDLGSLLSSDIQLARTLCRLIAKGHRWDVIHQHEWNAGQVARMARDALGVPLVGTMHLCITRLAQVSGDGALPCETDLYLRQMEGHLVTDPAALILCSQAYVDQIRQTFMTDRPIDLILNGIDLDEWNPSTGDARRSPITLDRPMVLYVGRIADMKGIRFLLDAVEVEDLGCTVVLAGEVNANTEAEKDEWEVTKRIRSLEACYPWRLRWIGFQHGQELRDLYAAARAVVMPSTHEPFGLVALEAMAMGVPLISTEVDGLGEIVKDGSEEFALIIPEANAAAIAEAIKILVRDDSACAMLRALGLRRAQAFSWERAADQTVAVYRRVTGR